MIGDAALTAGLLAVALGLVKIVEGMVKKQQNSSVTPFKLYQKIEAMQGNQAEATGYLRDIRDDLKGAASLADAHMRQAKAMEGLVTVLKESKEAQ